MAPAEANEKTEKLASLVWCKGTEGASRACNAVVLDPGQGFQIA